MFAPGTRVRVIHSGSSEFGRWGIIRRVVGAGIIQADTVYGVEIDGDEPTLNPDGKPWFPLFMGSALEPDIVDQISALDGEP